MREIIILSLILSHPLLFCALFLPAIFSFSILFHNIYPLPIVPQSLTFSLSLSFSYYLTADTPTRTPHTSLTFNLIYSLSSILHILSQSYQRSIYIGYFSYSLFIMTSLSLSFCVCVCVSRVSLTFSHTLFLFS